MKENKHGYCKKGSCMLSSMREERGTKGKGEVKYFVL